MTRNRNLSFGRLSTPSGIFRATVTKVNVDTISVRIPNLTGPNVYNDVPFYGDKPSVNDEIIVGFLNGNSATPVAMILTGEASTLTGGGSAGDIEGVTAGLGLSGGGTTGTVSLAFAPSELSSVTVATDDKVVIADTSDSDNPKHVTAQSIANLASASPGGSDHQVQFNDNSSFGGDANFTYDGSAVGLGATLTVGVNGTGHDVQFYGDSTDHWMKWDQSADELVLTLDSKLSFYDAAGGENIVAASDGHLEINAGTTLDLTAPTIDLNASTAVTVDGKIVFPATAPSDANINIEFAEGYKIYTDNTGAGSDNSRLWLDAPDNGEIVLGPRGGSDILDNMRLRSTTIAAEGNVNVTGNVGIGTTSPVGQLTVDSQNRQISIIDSGTVNYAEIRAHAVDNATGYANINYNAYSHTFLTEGTSRMHIGSSGNTYIGSSTRQILFQPGSNEAIKIIGNTASARPYISFWNQDASGNLDRKGYIGYPHGSSDSSYMYFRADQGTLDFGGKILLPTSANYVLWPATLNTVTSYSTLRRGTYSGTGNVVGYDGSSIRYKENVTNFVKSDWEKIYNLQAVRFTWKEEVAADKHASWGLISEDVYAEIPELGVMRVVEGVNDGNPVPDTVNYEQMCVFLLEAVKDLNTRLAAVE